MEWIAMTGGNNINKGELLKALKNSSGGKIDENAVNRAAGGDVNSLISSLDEDSRAKLMAALADKEKTRQILNSDAARALLGSLFGGNKNG